MHHEIKSGAKSEKVLWLVQLIDKLLFSHLLFTKWEKSVHFLRRSGYSQLSPSQLADGISAIYSWDCFLLNEDVLRMLDEDVGGFIDNQIFSNPCSSRVSKPRFLSFPLQCIFIHFPRSSWKTSEPAPVSILSFANSWRGCPKQSKGGLCQ